MNKRIAFSQEARVVVANAILIARQFSNLKVGPEHILMSILQIHDTPWLYLVFKDRAAVEAELSAIIRRSLPFERVVSVTERSKTAETSELLSEAVSYAAATNWPVVEVIHLLAVMTYGHGGANISGIFKKFHVCEKDVLNAFAARFPKGALSSTPAADAYEDARLDLTREQLGPIEKAYAGEFEAVAQKEADLRRELFEIERKKQEMITSAWYVCAVAIGFPDAFSLDVGLWHRKGVKIPDVKPKISVNGVICPFTVEVDQRSTLLVRVSVQKAIAGNPTKLSIRNENSSGLKSLDDGGLEIKNPFFFEETWFRNMECRWQCEGHADERKILMTPKDGEYPWNMAPGRQAVANFDLLSNGRLLDTYPGTYSTDGLPLTIEIPNVKKSDCIGKRVELRLSHLKGIKFILPPPIVMSVDRKPVR